MYDPLVVDTFIVPMLKLLRSRFALVKRDEAFSMKI